MSTEPEDGGGASPRDFESGSSESETPSSGHFDMSTLHDEIGKGAAPPPPAPAPPSFTVHSEETMGGYEEGEVAGGGCGAHHPPSPDSADSWMAYSSTSSEEWRGAAEEGKRARASPPAPSPPGGGTLLVPVVTPPPHPAPASAPAPRAERVDIRMIDFAHTAYAGAAAESPLATATPHHGPDCGFLTGVDSLKRLLTEILQPPPYS